MLSKQEKAFCDKLYEFQQTILSLEKHCDNEESTKQGMILPFLQLLGYDIKNPGEVKPEFFSELGSYKGNRVDYAIIINGHPAILIECKSASKSLKNLDKATSQLFHYYAASTAKFGILTNGLEYRFYADLQEINKMDTVPFLTFNFKSINESIVPALMKFQKGELDPVSIIPLAEELKRIQQVRGILSSELKHPSDDFIRFILGSTYEGEAVYAPKKSQSAIDRNRTAIQKGFNAFINDLLAERMRNVVSGQNDVSGDTDSRIITTNEEIRSVFIIQGILAGIVPIEKITYRDHETYFSINFEDNNRKPICRLNLDSQNKSLMLPDENKNFTRYYIESLNDLFRYKDRFIEIVKRY